MRPVSVVLSLAALAGLLPSCGEVKPLIPDGPEAIDAAGDATPPIDAADDAAGPDGAQVDAPAIDAPAIDAPAIDAPVPIDAPAIDAPVPIDAAIDAPPPIDAGPPVPLAVMKTGAGAGFGTVTSSPAGIVCGGDCSESFPHGTAVTLTATGGAGAVFDGWPAGSGCSGTGPCTLVLTAATTIAAPFSVAQYTVTVALGGTGTGTVTSSPAGIACPGTCTRTLAYGSTITLAAAPAANHTFTGWTGACTGTGPCAITVTGPAAATATFAPPPNVVFVTSTTHTGALGGLAGADAICQARAAGVNLAGTYRAWLSTGTVNAIDRLGSASGWVRPDGRPFANSRADLAAGRIFYPAVLNERGSPSIGNVWTATTATGALSGTAHCLNWTSGTETTGTQTYGSNEYGTFAWTSNGGATCTNQHHLYCFGVDHQATVAPPVATAVRRAFVTSGSWLPNTGIASADALCASEAGAASLPGTYRALLASSTASAASRFSTTGNPWARVDHVVLAPTATQLLASTGTHWQAALNVTASGAYVTSRTWAGAPNLSTPGMSPTGASTNCANWSTAAATSFGAVGISASSRILTAFANYTTAGSITACSSAGHKLTCLQQ